MKPCHSGSQTACAAIGSTRWPLARTLLEHEPVGRRMDFDTDIMVRLFWRGTPVLMTPVHVTYPDENTSNFDVVWDNVRITRMHTRLVLTMLARLPSILSNRPKYRERGQALVAAGRARRHLGAVFPCGRLRPSGAPGLYGGALSGAALLLPDWPPAARCLARLSTPHRTVALAAGQAQLLAEFSAFSVLLGKWHWIRCRPGRGRSPWSS